MVPQKRDQRNPFSDQTHPFAHQILYFPSNADETKLVLSSESWSAHSLSENKYKRGWRPIKVVEFDGFLRVILFEIWLELAKKHSWVERASVRTNSYILKAEQIRRLKPLAERLKEPKPHYLLA